MLISTLHDTDGDIDYGYNNQNQYNTAYGANGASDGGGFIGGEPQSSPAVKV